MPKSYREWTMDEDKHVISMWSSTKAEDIAEHLHRTKKDIDARVHHLRSHGIPLGAKRCGRPSKGAAYYAALTEYAESLEKEGGTK